jgi:hypothetical protein
MRPRDNWKWTRPSFGRTDFKPGRPGAPSAGAYIDANFLTETYILDGDVVAISDLFEADTDFAGAGFTASVGADGLPVTQFDFPRIKSTLSSFIGSDFTVVTTWTPSADPNSALTVNEYEGAGALDSYWESGLFGPTPGGVFSWSYPVEDGAEGTATIDMPEGATIKMASRFTGTALATAVNGTEVVNYASADAAEPRARLAFRGNAIIQSIKIYRRAFSDAEMLAQTYVEPADPDVPMDVEQGLVTITLGSTTTALPNFQGENFILTPAEGIWLTAIPGATGTGDTARSGAMVNPTDVNKQGFDGRINTTTTVGQMLYDESLNVALNLPRLMMPGESLIVAVSRRPELSFDELTAPVIEGGEGSNPKCISSYEVFTFVSELPAVNTIRPPWAGTWKPLFTTDDIDADLLDVVSGLTDPGSYGPFAGNPDEVNNFNWDNEKYAQTRFIDPMPGLPADREINASSAITASGLANSDQRYWYPRDWGRIISQHMIYSICNFPTSLDVAANLCKIGLDYMAQYRLGWGRYMGAGFVGNRKSVTAYTGKVLGNPDVQGASWSARLLETGNYPDTTRGYPFTEMATTAWPEELQFFYTDAPYSGYDYPDHINPRTPTPSGWPGGYVLYGDNVGGGSNNSDRDPAGKYVGCAGINSQPGYGEYGVRYQATDNADGVTGNQKFKEGGAYMFDGIRQHCMGILTLHAIGATTHINNQAMIDFIDWYMVDDNLAVAANNTLTDFYRDIYRGGAGNGWVLEVWNMLRDTSAPTLSDVVDTATGGTSGTGSITTNRPNGTLYWVLTTSATTPDGPTQIKLGLDHTGAAAVLAGSQGVTTSGVQGITGGFAGLTSGVTYYLHGYQESVTGEGSNEVSGDGFTPAGTSWTTVWERTLTSNDTGWHNGTLRNMIVAEGNSGAAGKMRITYRAHSTSALALDAVSMGLSIMTDYTDDPDQGEMTATPIAVTFASDASPSFTANEQKVSDEFDFPAFVTGDVLVNAADFAAANGNIRYISGLGGLSTGGTRMAYAFGADSAGSSAPLAVSFNGWVAMLEKVEVR